MLPVLRANAASAIVNITSGLTIASKKQAADVIPRVKRSLEETWIEKTKLSLLLRRLSLQLAYRLIRDRKPIDHPLFILTRITNMIKFTAFAGLLFRRPSEVSARHSLPDLSRLMASRLPRWARRVAEFGTGNITREILRLGIALGNLYFYEVRTAFCRILGERHADLSIFSEPTQELVSTEPL